MNCPSTSKGINSSSEEAEEGAEEEEAEEEEAEEGAEEEEAFVISALPRISSSLVRSIAWQISLLGSVFRAARSFWAEIRAAEDIVRAKTDPNPILTKKQKFDCATFHNGKKNQQFLHSRLIFYIKTLRF